MVYYQDAIFFLILNDMLLIFMRMYVRTILKYRNSHEQSS